MGINSSKSVENSSSEPTSLNTEKHLSNLDVLTNYYTEIGGMNFSIIEDLLVDILSFVPQKDLIRSCRLVCKSWKDVVDGHGVWKLKCRRENRTVPAVIFDVLPEHYYRNIYFYNPYGRNLIQNPCGGEGLHKWTITRNGGDGFVVENPPAGAEPVPKEVGEQSCFATACLPCIKSQVLNLDELGINKEILQSGKATIQIGEWCAARFDCASEYRLFVALLNEESDISQNEELFDERHVVDKIEFYFTEEQWIGKEWHAFKHTFKNVENTKFVLFQHYGKDCQFWAGNYGIKFTGAFVKVMA